MKRERIIVNLTKELGKKIRAETERTNLPKSTITKLALAEYFDKKNEKMCLPK